VVGSPQAKMNHEPGFNASGSRFSTFAPGAAFPMEGMAMMTKSASFSEARSQVRTALAAMGSGRPEAYIDCWAKYDDATLFGAWGPIEKG